MTNEEFHKAQFEKIIEGVKKDINRLEKQLEALEKEMDRYCRNNR